MISRPVEDGDIPVICGFPQSREELFFMFPGASYPLTPAQLQEAVRRRSDSTVVDSNGDVVGFANFCRWERGGCCTIGNVIVAPQARGCGVGRYLVETMIGLARLQHRAREVRLSCYNRNVLGLLLYSRIGFEPIAIEECRDWQGAPAALIHMRLAHGGH